MERKLEIDSMGRIEIPIVLLDELGLKQKDNLIIEIDNGSIVLTKKD